MADHVASEKISKEESFGTWTLWFAVAGAPAAWLVHLTASYSLEEWFACSPSNTDTGQILGLDVRTVALIITAAMALTAVAAGLAALSCLRKIKAGDQTENRRAHWMAIAGIMNSVLYLLIILAGVAPSLILDTCQRSP